jgi:predicted RNase H-like nuclease (RuvC/YqgF family)
MSDTDRLRADAEKVNSYMHTVSDLEEAVCWMNRAQSDLIDAMEVIKRLQAHNHEARTQMAVDAERIAALEDEAERLRTRIANDQIRMAQMAECASGEL